MESNCPLFIGVYKVLWYKFYKISLILKISITISNKDLANNGKQSYPLKHRNSFINRTF